MKETILILVLGALLASNLAVAEDIGFPDEVDWKVSAYVWGMGIEGDAGIGDIVAPVDMNFSDILDMFRGGGSMIVRADQGAHAFTADISYFRLTPDDALLPNNGGVLDVDIDIALVEAAYMHKWPTESGYWGLRGGLRYWDVEINMDLTGGPMDASRNEGDDWIDGIIGVGGMRLINDRWSMLWTADVGAGGSDSAYAAQAVFQRKLNNGNLVSIGARYWSVDYEGTAGDAGKFLFDVDILGVLLGFTFD